MDDGYATGLALVKTGTLVSFDVAELVVRPMPGSDESEVRVELWLSELDEDGQRAEGVEWGAFGFMFVLAVLSFAEATPAGASVKDFVSDDQFTVADLFECLRCEAGELRLSADYIRGRRLKTDITVRPDGRVTLATRCRGDAAKRWVEKLQGPRRLKVM